MPVLCEANARHLGRLSIPVPSSQEVTAAFSRDWLVLGRIKEPVAGRAQGKCKAPSSPGAQGQSGCRPSLCPC